MIAASGAALILAFGQPVLDALSQTEAMGQLAWHYIAWFTIVIAGVALCQNITVTLYATGRSRLPFYGNLLELPANALLSYALINGVWGFPALGLSGAAIGSAVAVGLRAAFLVAVLLVLEPGFTALPWRSVAAARRAVRYHFGNALPIAGTFISATLALQVCMLIYAQLPVREFALLTLLIVLSLIRTSNTICGNVLRAGGDAGYSLKIHVSVQWLVTVPLSVLLVLVLDLSLIWVFVIMVIDELVKALPFHRRMYSGRWKRRLVIEA